MLFSEYIIENKNELFPLMEWYNYGLNDYSIDIIMLLKNHAIDVLLRDYGHFYIDSWTNFDSQLKNDIFVYFPTLVQKLKLREIISIENISQLTEKIETTIIETKDREFNSDGINNTTQNIENTNKIIQDINSVTTQQNEGDIQQKSVNNDTSTLSGNLQQTGTNVNDTGTVSNGNNSTNNIETFTANPTSNRSVQLSHNMPEQGQPGNTNNFPLDSQGSPILPGANVQSAGQNFQTINQQSTSGNSNISTTNSNKTDTKNTLSLNTTDTTNQTQTQVGNNTVDTIDKSKYDTINTGDNITDESGEQNATNVSNTKIIDDEKISRNYTEKIQKTKDNTDNLQDITGILEMVENLIAFKWWTDKFYWIVGIL